MLSPLKNRKEGEVLLLLPSSLQLNLGTGKALKISRGKGKEKVVKKKKTSGQLRLEKGKLI